MTYDPSVPARERTPYGNFQLRPTHLKTGTVVCSYADPEELVLSTNPDPEVARREAARIKRDAQEVVAGRVLDTTVTAELLDYLGIR